jgi:hypothetical protein
MLPTVSALFCDQGQPSDFEKPRSARMWQPFLTNPPRVTRDSRPAEAGASSDDTLGPAYPNPCVGSTWVDGGGIVVGDPPLRGREPSLLLTWHPSAHPGAFKEVFWIHGGRK